MTPERWQRVYDLFNELVLLSTEDRAALLAKRCAGEPELRAHVERLLQRDQQAEQEDFLAPPTDTKADGLPLNPTASMHIRCPHCRNPIELVDLMTASQVLCPSCGSTFHVERPVTLPGTQGIAGRHVKRFELIEAVGSGAFGTVYMARDPKLARTVALKVLRGGLLASDDLLTRFKEEALSQAQLAHEAIVSVHEVDEIDGIPFIVRDFVRGITLAESIRVRRPTHRETARLLAELADALHYAHEKGVVHRDVKPRNVMIDENGRPHLVDFGLAKRESCEIPITLEGQVLGTPAYMPPEQARGEHRKVDRRSDVYSLGVVCYELLTGELPFRGNTRMLLDQVLHDEPRPPRKLNDQIPRDLETICLKAMAKEPAARYQTARDLASDLRRFLDGKPVQARPINPGERLWRWCRRNPRLAAALGIALASLVAVTALSVLYATNRDHMFMDSSRHLALVNFELGRADCERGEVGAGLHWLRRSLGAATAAGDADWTRFALASLAAWRAEYPELKAVFSHRGDVNNAEFSPDGQIVLTCGYDGTARLWDVATSRPAGAPMRHDDRIRFATFSPDGRKVLTVSQDRTARLWDAGTGESIQKPLSHEAAVEFGTFSPDAQLVLTLSDDNRVTLWNSGTGERSVAALRHPAQVTAAAFTPDGKTVLTASLDGKVRLWDASTGRLKTDSIQHGRAIWAMALSPDGKTILTGSEDKTARFWNAATGKPKGPPLEHDSLVWALEFSPDGKFCATASDSSLVRLWDVSTGLPRNEPFHHGGRVWSVKFSPNGKALLTAGWDHTARLWDTSTGQQLGRAFEHRGLVTTAVFSRDGKNVLTASTDWTARLWSAGTESFTVRNVLQEDSAGAAVFSSDGGRIFVGTDSGEAMWCQTSTGKEIGKRLSPGGRICRVALSRDDKVALTCGLDGKCQFWALDSGDPIGEPILLGARISGAAFSSDGKIALIGSFDHTARLYHKNGTGFSPLEPVFGHGDEVWSVALSPDGRIVLTASKDGTARLWDAGTGRQRASLTHANGVCVAAFSPDGRLVLTASLDGTARLWDPATGRPHGQPLNHDCPVLAAAFSADGKIVLTGSKDGTARIWEVATGLVRGQPLVGHREEISAIAFSPDGRLAATTSDDRTARLWDVTLGRPVGPPLRHPARLADVAFSPDPGAPGLLLTTCQGHPARLWNVPRLAPEPAQLAHWVESLTGLQQDEQGTIRPLETDAWRAHRRAATSATGTGR
jgi:WD40 repeat protein